LYLGFFEFVPQRPAAGQGVTGVVDRAPRSTPESRMSHKRFRPGAVRRLCSRGMIGDFLEGSYRRGMVMDSSSQNVCNRGGSPEPSSIECFAMPTVAQRIANAFAVLFGQYADVTKMARDREPSRQSLHREAAQTIDAVNGTAAQARVAELEQPVDQLRSQGYDLQQRRGRPVEMTPQRQAELTCVAQAEGVSLPIARRILQVLLPPKTRSVSTRGRATAAAGRRAGRLLEVLDEAARPRVTQATADEIFSTIRERAKTPAFPDNAAPARPGVTAVASWSAPSS
jgi:hypothetical protein